MPLLCPTGSFWEEKNFAILDELLNSYDVDGLFYNYLQVTRCYCARCRAKVRREATIEVPSEGVRCPAFETWRARHLAFYTRRMRDFIHALRPDAILVPYHHVRAGWNMAGMAEASDVIGAQISNPVVPNPVDPQPIWSHWAAEEALIARALLPSVGPFCFKAPRASLQVGKRQSQVGGCSTT